MSALYSQNTVSHKQAPDHFAMSHAVLLSLSFLKKKKGWGTARWVSGFRHTDLSIHTYITVRKF